MITIKNLLSFSLLFLVFALTGCSGGGSGDGDGDGGGGGSTTTYSVGGSISGLSGSGMLLQNNTGNDLAITANGSFTFSSGQADGGVYAVTVKTQPNGQMCSITNGSGTIAGTGITNVSITCVTTATTTYTVGGSVSSLTGTGLVLQNNASDDLLISADGAFAFTAGIADGNSYDVSIKTHPSGQLCSVSNGTGTVAAADVADVAISCTTAYTIGGTVSGLSGMGLVLQNNGGDNLNITANGAFTFPAALLDSSSYNVAVLTQPGTPNQICVVSSGSGTIAASNVTNVAITCTTVQYTIAGTVSGLAGTGLVLQNNAGDNLSITANGSFTFATSIDDGSDYAVTILTQPGNPVQTCSVTNGSGTVSGANVTNVSLSCTTNTYSFSGTVSGLTGTGLVLQNNGGDNLSITADGSFSFATALADTSTYAVTVNTQSSGQICSVSNGSGTLAGSNITNVLVSCIAIPTYTIGGTVSGLSGSGLVLQNNLGDDLAISANGTFTFATDLLDSSSYSVTIKTQPISPNQTCTVNNGSGTLSANVTNVTVACTTNTYTIGGNVSGLSGTGLVLQNNAANDLSITANGGFNFTSALADGSSYAVTVKTQPTSQFCSVTTGIGTLAGANITAVNVSCGDVPTYSIGLSVSGLTGNLVLQNNGGDDLSISTNGSFTFPTALIDSSSYAVTILTKPVGQSCVLTNSSGTISAANVTNISVVCTDLATYTIGGSVTGLTGTGLVLQNNAADDLGVSADGVFTFAAVLYDTSSYVVTVSTQPTGQFCTVTNGSSILAGANVTNVAVSCGPIPTYTIGGTVAGLSGTGLVLQNNAGDDLAVTVDGAFTFATVIEEGSTYAITVLTQPTAPNQTCMVVNSNDTVSGGNVTNVAVVCESRSWGTAALFEADNRINVYNSRVAIDPNGNAVILWEMWESPNGKILAKYFDATSNSWGAAKILSTENLGDAEDARIAMDANGNAIAMWAQDDGTYTNIWASRYDAVAGTWGTAILIENNPGGAGGFDEIRLVMHANGNAIAVWPQYTDGKGSIWVNHFDVASGNWGTAELLENDDTNMARSPDIGMDASGNAIAVWWQDPNSNNNVWARRYDAAAGSWGTAEVIENFSSLSREVRMDMNANGDAIVAWRQYGDSSEQSIATNRYDATSGTWGTATYIEARTEVADMPSVALDTAGNAIVLWEQSDGTALRVWSNRYDVASAGWGTPVVVASGYKSQLVMNSSGNAIAAWVSSDGVQRSAWVSHYNAVAGGWSEATTVETSDRYVWYPEVDMNDSGDAVTTWAQRDFYDDGSTFSSLSRDNIWVNHYSSVPVSSYITTFTIGGSVSGLTDTGLVLQNNAGDDLAISANGGFTFPTAIFDGASYIATVKNQPNGQFCIVTNGKGVLVGSNVTDVTSVAISCEALPSYTVNGSVSGLTGSGLVLQNNAGDDITISAGGSFTFPTALFGGQTYAVAVKTQPAGQACAVTSGNGTITGANISNVSVSCAIPYTIGGAVSGLSGTGLVLQNNAGDDVEITGDGIFTFLTSVVDGFGYDVRVRVQPAGQSCSVSGGVGTVAAADVTTAAVSCVDLAVGEYLVSGTVSGLVGSGLVLQNNAGDDLALSVDGSFTFPGTLADTNSYNVSIKSQPTNPRQTCSITSSWGLIAAAHVSGVEISCAINAYTVQAKVSGLKGSGLVIRNNGGDYTLVTGNLSYIFDITLPDSSPYNVSIKTQPAGQNCSVINANGTVSGVNVTDVEVSCRDNGLYSIGGTVTNLRSNDLSLVDISATNSTFVSSDGSFTLYKLQTTGAPYNVTVGIQPVGQTCSVSNGNGTVGTTDVSNISVNCVSNAGVNHYSIGGAVSGLKGSGLILQNNKGDDITIAADGSFTFPRTRTDGSWYSVSVKQQPTNLNQSCSVQSGGGQLAGANVTDVSVDCYTNKYTVSGTITGLAGSSVSLDMPGYSGNRYYYADGSFSFTNIPDGTAFRVRVTNQPTGLNQTCTVINGASTINGVEITNLQVNCVTNQYTVGGRLQGMKGSGLLLSNNSADEITLSANGAFVFPTSIDDGSTYAASILAQPVSPIQDCLIANNNGTLAGTNINNVVVNCNPWTWVSGSDVRYAPGVLGTLGVADVANVPRARSSAASWKDSSGNFWLFGGFSNSSTPGYMSDIWKYDPVAGLWTWMKGSQAIGLAPVFGVQGVADPANDPGARADTMSWQDASGNFWLFSGNNYNDLWKYDTATGNWTWVSGTNQTYQNGIYTPVLTGPNKTPAFPGMRRGGTTWTDASGNLWLFGGDGKSSTIYDGRLNDLWKYDPVTDLWTWESGSDASNQIGVYGTQGVADALNTPGSRVEAVSWTDTSGNLWLFGGRGYDSTGTSVGDLNDLWKYDVTTGNWTWVSGSNLVNQAGSFGTIGTASASNVPPPKKWAFAQTDSNGNFWLYGGTSTDVYTETYSDLWKYDVVTGLWTWMAGSNSSWIHGIYGTLGVPDALNMPGSRNSPVGWFDASDTLWLFGGAGYPSSGSGGELNDLWKITP